MVMMTAEAVYEEHIKAMPVRERLRLMALVAGELAQQPIEPAARPTRSIMELHGLGREIWQGVNAQEYVDALRTEWDDRP